MGLVTECKSPEKNKWLKRDFVKSAKRTLIGYFKN